jgi:hypothetical protein
LHAARASTFPACSRLSFGALSLSFSCKSSCRLIPSLDERRRRKSKEERRREERECEREVY